MKQGVVLLPMTAGEIVLAYNLPGCRRQAEAAARRLSGHLPRQDHQVERPANRSGQPERDTARPADHRGPAFGLERHHLRLHQAPRRHQRGFKQGPGAGTTVRMAEERQDRRGAEERRRDRDHQADAGRDRLHRIWLRQAYEDADCAKLQNKAGKFVAPAARAARPRWRAPSLGPICARGSRIRRAPRPIRSRPLPGCSSTRRQDAKKAEALRRFRRVRPDRGPGDRRQDGLHPAAREAVVAEGNRRPRPSIQNKSLTSARSKHGEPTHFCWPRRNRRSSGADFRRGLG